MGKILLVTPVLPVDVLKTAAFLEENGLLECLITRYSPSLAFAKILARSGLTKRFSKRPVAAVAAERKIESLLADLVYYFTRPLSRTRAVDCSFSVVDRIASHRVHGGLGAAMAREDSAIATFQRATAIGITKIYGLPTAYWGTVRRLMAREEEEFPGICRAAADEARSAHERLPRKNAELAAADFVLAPSTFVGNSLSDAPRLSAKTKVLPFGFESDWSVHAMPQSRPVFLYAGNITMRKGLHRVLRAWKKLNAYRRAELRLIGDMFLKETFLRDYRGTYTHVPRLPRAELQRHYAGASALLFNAMADGFGYVIAEAMSSGVPVIASRNSGAPDVLEHQREGLLVEYGADDQLETAIDRALTQPADLAAMGANAREAAAKLTWGSYGEKLIAWLRSDVLNRGR